MQDQEKIYDDLISPLMQQILELCAEHKIPMFASFQFSEMGFCTSAQEHDGNPVMRYHRALAQCAQGNQVNIDKFMYWVAKECDGKRHSSMVLMRMGVPTNPETELQPE